MNKNQNTSQIAPIHGKFSPSFIRLLRKCAWIKTVLVFDLSLNQEKLPIIYANIRV